MTGAEREDFRELRAEVRESFAAVIAKLDTIEGRVNSLETSRAIDQALLTTRRRHDALNWTRTVAIASIVSGLLVATVQLFNFVLTQIVPKIVVQ